jgi:hypothetical protein
LTGLKHATGKASDPIGRFFSRGSQRNQRILIWQSSATIAGARVQFHKQSAGPILPLVLSDFGKLSFFRNA